MLSKFNQVPIVEEAKKAKFKPHPVLQVIIFIVLFFVVQIVASVIYMLIVMSNQYEPESFSSTNNGLLINLFVCIIPATLTILYCRFVEGRNLYSMGFVKNDALKNYLKGMLIGFVLFGSVYAVLLLTGAVSFNGLNDCDILLLILFFIGFMIQGAEEEILMRGYFMMSLSTRMPIVIAVVISSSLFGIAHIFNDGFDIVSMINIVLIGIFFSVYMLKTNNIWGACAIHSVWNFVQGNFYGLPVSGGNMGTSVFSSSSIQSKEFLNGGTFGPEGGIVTTIVCIIAVILVLVLIKTPEKKDLNKIIEIL